MHVVSQASVGTGDEFLRILHFGVRRGRSRYHTYVITTDMQFRFSETGAPFAKDFMFVMESSCRSGWSEMKRKRWIERKRKRLSGRKIKRWREKMEGKGKRVERGREERGSSGSHVYRYIFFYLIKNCIYLCCFLSS